MDDEPPLSVKRYDEGRYLVRSERPACENHYLVDMADRKFPHGRCECTDYNVRVEAPLRRHEEPERLTCKHIDSVNATLAHAQQLCEAAGIAFHPRIIPLHGEQP